LSCTIVRKGDRNIRLLKGGKEMKKVFVAALLLVMVPFVALAQQMTKFAVATVQMTPAHLDKKANVEKMVRFIKEAANKGAKLIVFPEMITTGYVGPITPPEYAGFYKNAEPIPGPTTMQLQKLAEENGVYVVFGMPERGESNLGPVIYNSAAIVGPKGFIAGYRKVHLPLGEKNYFHPGNEIKVFDTNLGRIGLLVCYDFWFPESSRIAALKGAQIIIDVANWPVFDTDPWFALGPGIAASNKLWFVGVNRVGGEEFWPGFGGSQVVGPSGKVVLRANDKEGVSYATIDLDELTMQRAFPPIYMDRRVDLYEPLLKK
jgi:N-carbamoylputrescine amidase